MASASATTYSLADTVRRLRDSLADVEFAVVRVPERWHHELSPEVAIGSWTVAMNLAHLTIYEENVGLMLLRSFAPDFDAKGERRGGDESWFLSQAQELAATPIAAILPRLRAARTAQIELVETYGEERLNAGVTPLWSDAEHTAGWVATKTFQHTWEHGNAILRAALFAPR